ncbi:hypothetical protein [Halomicronema sp. CCY15110]|uniref:hypothetical protein n=1 Tax=Halomicronema sp. CCY15110 TaxID=2767773 RepID=UPI001950D155|nr:hypothetical protein [Halomicronema sp. CCY15110]
MTIMKNPLCIVICVVSSYQARPDRSGQADAIARPATPTTDCDTLKIQGENRRMGREQVTFWRDRALTNGEVLQSMTGARAGSHERHAGEAAHGDRP